MLKRITNNKRKIVPNLIPKSKLVMRGNHCKQSEPKPLFPQLMRKKIEFSISLTAYFEKWFFSFACLQAKWSENCFLHSSPLHQNVFLWSDIKTFCHNHKTFFFWKDLKHHTKSFKWFGEWSNKTYINQWQIKGKKFSWQTYPFLCTKCAFLVSQKINDFESIFW